MTETLLAKLRLNGCNSRRGSSDSTAAPSEKSCQEEHMVSEKLVIHCNTLENMQFGLALVCERLNAAIYMIWAGIGGFTMYTCVLFIWFCTWGLSGLCNNS